MCGRRRCGREEWDPGFLNTAVSGWYGAWRSAGRLTEQGLREPQALGPSYPLRVADKAESLDALRVVLTRARRGFVKQIVSN